MCLSDADEPVYVTLKPAPVYVTLKPAPEEGGFRRGQYEDVLPGYACNEVHWNAIRADGQRPRTSCGA